MYATFPTLENSWEVINHIVVCGVHSSIYHFILPLRAKYLKTVQPIVIITKEPFSPQRWDSISIFPAIYLIYGSPIEKETLQKANINYANKAVILGKNDLYATNDEMLDAETIFIYKSIKSQNSDLQILTELVYSSNIEFLLPLLSYNLDFQFSTLYAAGEVYFSSIIDTLTC